MLKTITLAMVLVAACRGDQGQWSASGGATGVGGAGGAGGTSFANSGGMVGMGGNRGEGLGPELCSLSAGCFDGEVHGTFGDTCDTIALTCPLGCSASASVPPLDSATPWSEVQEALWKLCVQPDDGSVGDGPDGCGMTPGPMNPDGAADATVGIGGGAGSRGPTAPACGGAGGRGGAGAGGAASS